MRGVGAAFVNYLWGHIGKKRGGREREQQKETEAQKDESREGKDRAACVCLLVAPGAGTCLLSCGGTPIAVVSP